MPPLFDNNLFSTHTHTLDFHYMLPPVRAP